MLPSHHASLRNLQHFRPSPLSQSPLGSHCVEELSPPTCIYFALKVTKAQKCRTLFVNVSSFASGFMILFLFIKKDKNGIVI